MEGLPALFKMLLIAPYPKLAEQFTELLKEFEQSQQRPDYEKDTCSLAVIHATGPESLRDSDLTADVVIARGFTATHLALRPQYIPVVEIPIAANDLLRALYRAKEQSADRKTAVIGSPNMIMGVEELGQILEMEVHPYPVRNQSGLEQAVHQAVADGFRQVIGGIYTCDFAEQLGLQSILLESGKEALWHAITEAKKVAYISRRDRERAQNFRAVLNTSRDGVIAIDPDFRIEVWNAAASRILNLYEHTVLGKDIRQVIPNQQFVEFISRSTPEGEELIRIEQLQLAVSRTSIPTWGESVRILITIQEVARLQEIETRIRKKMYHRGHVARHSFEDIIGESPLIVEAVQTAKRFSRVDSNILISGSTGTGKELFAQSIHTYSNRKSGPFVAVNCAALSESLLESELFGYVEGAFTGASRGGRMGLFELAHGGTIFLDEISEIPSHIQGKLLRVIQEKEITRLGHDRVIPVDVRIICATNRDLHGMVLAGEFRDDLYYRLDILKLDLPSLQERREDIPMIAEHWIRTYSREFHVPEPSLTQLARTVLMAHDWPGNIRQLRNVCERLVVLSQCSVIDLKDIHGVLGKMNGRRRDPADSPVEVPRMAAGEPVLWDPASFERERIISALNRSGNCRRKSAELLGISRTTLWRHMRELDLG